MSDGGGHQGAEGRDGSISEPQILGHQGRNVTVVVRVRPLSADEARAERHCDEGAIDVRGPNDLVLNVEGSRRRHSFDHVLGPSCSQEAVFRRVGQPAVDNCLSGYNSTILAYGQTGSGKTHTILGDFIDIGPFLPLASSKPDTVVAAAKPNIHLRTSESKYATKPAQQWAELPPEAGLTPRVFSYLFEQVAEKTADPDGGTTFAVRVSFIEIYNEVVTDLLSGASGLPVRQSLSTRSTYVEGVAEEQVFGISDAMALVSRGNERRKVAHTNMNAASSRSHSILSCTIEGRAEEHGGVARVRRAVLNLVDLAGSERQTRTGATGARLKEASSINKSLSTLGHVILSLVSGSPHVPYRDSKLTHILQDSLGGNAKAVMIAAVSPSTPSLPETEGTLGFASRARRMKNTAVVNEDAAGDARALRRENERLRKELEAFRALEASRVAGPYCSAALLAENERLRAEAHALR